MRGFPNYSEDLNIFKVFPMADQKKLRFEASIGNLFNRVSFLRSERELEPGRLRLGQHPVQPAALGAGCVAVRLLAAASSPPARGGQEIVLTS